MYCKKCYYKLDPSDAAGCCPNCGRAFTAADRRTWLTRPFPSWRRMVLQILLTTLIGGAIAYVVAAFQIAAFVPSGH